MATIVKMLIERLVGRGSLMVVPTKKAEGMSARDSRKKRKFSLD